MRVRSRDGEVPARQLSLGGAGQSHEFGIYNRRIISGFQPEGYCQRGMRGVSLGHGNRIFRKK